MRGILFCVLREVNIPVLPPTKSKVQPPGLGIQILRCCVSSLSLSCCTTVETTSGYFCDFLQMASARVGGCACINSYSPLSPPPILCSFLTNLIKVAKQGLGSS